MNIGFDLDGIFVDKPPFIPHWIIERLYVKDVRRLTYRIPSQPEQLIRKVAHAPFLRPPVSKNIDWLLRYAKKNNTHTYYLVSGRFGFLQKETEQFLKHYTLDRILTQWYINNRNNQPHLFKNAMLKKISIHRFVDDDLPMLKFLAQKNPRIKFFWLNRTNNGKLMQNLLAITKLSDLFK